MSKFGVEAQARSMPESLSRYSRRTKVNILQKSNIVPCFSQRLRFLFPAAFFLLLGAYPAAAFPQFLTIVKTTYSVKSGGGIDAKRCAVCHADPGGGGALNPYGTSVKTFLKTAGTQTLSPKLLHSIDETDSDGDGFANIDEFKSDMLPGDPTSHPSKKPTMATREVKAEGEVSPFDIKTAVLARSAQHPVLVHFPIALFVVSLLLDIIGTWKKKEALRTAAHINLILAAFGALIAVISGLIAWQLLYHGAELKGNLRLHLILGIVTTGLLFVLWTLRTRLLKNPTPAITRLYFFLGIVAFILIALTGHIGGILSGVVQPLE